MKTIIEREAQVPYTPAQMYALVNDVEAYSQFLPWCHAAEVTEKTDTMMVATIEVAVAGFNKGFTTRNILTPNERIEMNHVDGPFKSLLGVWEFKPLAQGGSQIHLRLEFEVANGIKFAFFGMLFNKAADRLVDAFVERAKVLYGSAT